MSQAAITQSLLIEKVTRSDGLPSHQIHSLCYAQRKLWLGTPNGLAVYNGENVEILNQSTGLLSHGQRSVVVAENNILAASDLGLSVIDAKSHQVIASINTVDEGLGWCQCASYVGEGQYLLGCGKGLYLWYLASGQLSEVNHEISNESVIKIVQSPEGLTLVQMAHSGLWIYQNSQLKPLLKHHKSLFNRINYINVSKYGFIMSDESSIILLDFELNLKEQFPLPDGGTSANCLYQNRPEHLVVADNEQAFKLTKHDGNWQVSKRLLTDVSVNDFCYDAFNNLWIATDFSGLYKYSALNNYIQNFAFPKQTSVLAIRESGDKQGLLVAGIRHSFLVSPTNQFSPLEIQGLREQTVWDIYQDNNLAVWGACNEGLVYSEFEQPHKKSNSPVIFKDRTVGAGRCIQPVGEELLYGSVSGLFVFNFKEKSFTPVNDPKGKTLSYVYSITAKNTELFYVATLGRGLWLYHRLEKNLTRVDLNEINQNVYDLSIREDGKIVIAADDYILLMDDERVVKLYQSSDSVAAWACRWYNRTEVILGTSQGLKILNVDTREFTFLLNNIPQRRYWEFTTSRSLLRTDSGDYWCGLNDGLTSVKTEHLIDNVRPPIPEIYSIQSSVAFQLKDDSFIAPQSNSNLEISLCCFWLWDSKSIQYRYRLVGFHEQSRIVRNTPIVYSSLPAGEYLLEIEVKNSLAQTKQKYQLLLIQIKKTGFLSNTFNTITELLKRTYGKFVKRRNFWRLYQRHLELERIVQHRTQELSLANRQLVELNTSLESLSNRDQLTGLYNRRAFMKFTDNELKRGGRLGSPMSILMIDIDFFKQYNDNYGHLAGDICLKKVANCLLTCLHRSGDILARYGGEEFIIALPDIDLANAQMFAQICVNSIREQALIHEFSKVASHITISVGINSQNIGKGLTKNGRAELLTQLIDEADKNLYQAKQQGRNQFFPGLSKASKTA